MISRKKILFGLIPVFAFILMGALAFSLTNSPAEVSGEIIRYDSSVCTSVERVDGSREELGCSHNLVVDSGLDAVRDILGVGTTFGAFDYIGLCNATAGCGAPAAGDTTLENEYAAGGLSRAQATYGEIGTGNWSLAKTFTATADALETNKTGIFNQSSGGTLLAENTFTLVTLQTNDQLTVNWTIYVTSG